MNISITKYLNVKNNYRIFLKYAKEKSLHPGVRKHSENIGWMFFAKLASMVIAFLATAYIARNLGPTNYGQLSYAISFVSLFGFLASLGIDQILYRELIKYPEKRNVYMGSALAIRIIASIFTIILCLLSAKIWSTNDVSLFLIFLISLTFFFSSFQLLSYEFQADAKLKYPSLLSIVVVIILNLLKIFIIFNDKGVIYLASIILLEPILYSLAYGYLRVKIYGNITNLKFDKIVAVSILKDSFPLIFASAFFAIYARIDQVMIKNMINTESVGLYDSAVRLSEISYFIPNILVAALFPAIINAKKISNELYYKRTKKLLLTLIIISTVVALITTLLSKYIVTIVFGVGFIGAVSVLKIYVWSNIGAALNLLIHQILIAENYTKNVSITIFFGMITNVILNLILIPKYGMNGAAFASLISYLIPFLSLLLFKKTKVLLLSILKS